MASSEPTYQRVVRGGLKLKASTCVQPTRGGIQKKRRISSGKASATSSAVAGGGSSAESAAVNADTVKGAVEASSTFSQNVSQPSSSSSVCDAATVVSVDVHSQAPVSVVEEELLGDMIHTDERLTPAEKAFRLAQKKRESARIAKRLELTHRQRMEKFNSQLKRLPEHFDIPKVGPG